MAQAEAKFRPTASLEMLRRRSELTLKIHQFFSGLDFVHVETPLLSHDTVVDRYIEPIAIEKSGVTGRDDDRETLWLQTSPEFCMKRLLAAGAPKIYQIAKSFRKGESGRHHNPEFTMLEWYRVGDDLESGIKLLSDFASLIFKGSVCQMVSYGAAFKRYAGVDPFFDPIDAFSAAVKRAGVSTSQFSGVTERDAWLNLILTHLVEPKLGIEAPEIIYDWPASQSALAIVRERQPPAPPVAERFELYVNGVELANGYHELLDPDELSRRNEINNAQRLGDGNGMLPSDSRLDAAMRSGIPQCAGVAVGVDRLLMAICGCQDIDEVIAFPMDRA